MRIIKLKPKSLEKRMLKKITPWVAKRVLEVCEEEQCDLQDLANTAGLLSSRISELVHYKNYPYGGCTERNLSLLIQGGIITVEEIKKNNNLTDDEIKLLDEKYSLYEDQETRTLIIQCKRAGIDYKQALKKLIAKNKS